MLRQPWTVRTAACLSLASAVLVFLWRLSYGWQFTSSTHRLGDVQASPTSHELPQRQREFWQQYYHDLTESRPNCTKIIHEKSLDVVGLHETPPPRPMKVVLEHEQHLALKTAHTAFMSRLRTKEYELPYVPSTRGVVMTAGGTYLVHALVTIRMLRRTGTNLPVEVFLRDPSEGDPRICDDIFPALNAKCIALSDTLGNDISAIGKYGYKMIAMMLSSFEDYLYLDADCFPIYNPDVLFTKAPFTTHGLVLWPDFWYPTESPLFFDIANIAMPRMDHSQVASEAGTILYSKRTHSLSLLIATYYNFFGPDFYYKLLSQGALGEGDKETFRWSAVAGDLPWYQVKAKVEHLGFTTQNGERQESVMAQYNPMTDFTATSATLAEVRPFFMHAHNPKLDPEWMFSPKRTSTIFDSDGSMRRIWHENATQAKDYFGSGFDPEMGLWEEMRDMACEYDGYFSREACELGTVYVKEVFGGASAQVRYLEANKVD